MCGAVVFLAKAVSSRLIGFTVAVHRSERSLRGFLLKKTTPRDFGGALEL
jgi:hypothetical protein